MTRLVGLEYSEPILFERKSQSVGSIEDFSLRWQEEFSNDKKETGDIELPNFSEPELVRHFTKLSRKNFSIDTSPYPLGSCTMKYNPKINEWAARLPSISMLHPSMPNDYLQHAFKIMWELQTFLCEIGGFHQVSLNPSAGAQGEFCGLAIILKRQQEKGEKRQNILVPMSAHGTNPSTASMFGLNVVPLNIGQNGQIMIDEVARKMDANTVGLMITNPNTLGIFESNQLEISKIIHDKGGYVFGDGANLNALMGIVRPGDIGIDVMHFNLHKTFSTPHGGGGPGTGAIGASKELSPYLPVPLIEKHEQTFIPVFERPESIGRIRSFYGNFGLMVRAWLYIKSLGADGIKYASILAVLNANYVKASLKKYFHLPYDVDCLHEVVFSDKIQKKSGVKAMDIGKAMIDHGIHPPTINFPLVVDGALMIEPTETESINDLNMLIDELKKIALSYEKDADNFKHFPQNTNISRADETYAARNLYLNYKKAK